MSLHCSIESNGNLLRPAGRSVSRLLVSVRSCEEAAAAIDGGTDILDIKEPSRGSLGMSDIGGIRSIAEFVARACPAVPVSAALGELSEWRRPTVDIPRLPDELTFAKLGLSGLGSKPEWRTEWLQVRNLFDKQRARRIAWVAVAYADERIAQSPPLDEIITAALETDCAGLLIDTFSKSGRTLTDCIDAATLRSFADRCHSAGLFFALAGSLGETSLKDLVDVEADVIAIRTAACENQRRDGRICPNQVAAFRRSLDDVAASRNLAAREH
jgi:(5-formylfuran-3-yl)methyl phosphate synthase